MTRLKKTWMIYWGGKLDFLLNELSLHGQFPSMEAFVASLKENIHCFQLINNHEKGHIWKTNDVYGCYVTKDKKLGELKQYPKTDELKRLRISFDKEIITKPFWDEAPRHDLGGTYLLDNEDVTATAVAEAVSRDASILSFASERYADRILDVIFEGKSHPVSSSYTACHLVEKFGSELGIDRDSELKIRYSGTRIDCSDLEKRYGAETLEEKEYSLLIGTLDKFVLHDSWESIGLDDGLEYKKYSPSKEDDWFRYTPYVEQQIMKFRFSDKMRCYGYRKGDRFRLLRLERDHKQSDKG